MYKWDFGDQTDPEEVSPEEGVTRAVATHAYADHRPFPYTVTLTVTAQSDAGEIESVSQVNAFVIESRGFVVSGWNVGDTFKTSVRGLQVVAQVGLSVAITLAVFSPVWLVVGVALVFGKRRLSARRQARAEARQAEDQNQVGESDE